MVLQVGTSAGGDVVNQNSDNYVNWNWKANGSGSSNTDGTINSTVSVNTTAGFSIVKYTGTWLNAYYWSWFRCNTKLIIVKRLNDTSGTNWTVYHKALGNANTYFYY